MVDSKNKTLLWPHCPVCGIPMSEWFTWGGKMYCYPCGPLSPKRGKVITEDQADWKDRCDGRLEETIS